MTFNRHTSDTSLTVTDPCLTRYGTCFIIISARPVNCMAADVTETFRLVRKCFNLLWLSPKVIFGYSAHLRMTPRKQAVSPETGSTCTRSSRCFFACLWAALVNKGNVMYNRGDFEKAREFYREALQNDSSCVEALYNFGNDANSLTIRLLKFIRADWPLTVQVEQIKSMLCSTQKKRTKYIHGTL